MKAKPGRDMPALAFLSEEISKRVSRISAELRGGTVPSDTELDALARLLKLRQMVSPGRDRHKKWIEITLLCLLALMLIGLTFIRIPATAIDLEVRATKIRMTLTDERSSTLIPGELGEILALRQARVSGADEVSPPVANDSGSFELRQLVSKNAAPAASPEELAVRLQEISVPPGIPLKVAVGVAYAADLRGLVFEAAGEKPSTARFGEVIPIAAEGTNVHAIPYAIRPIRATGKDLVLELFPANSERQLTVFRDENVSEISFEDMGHSTILGGSALIKSGAEGGVHLQPSDHLTVRSSTPMLVRELSLSKGELTAILSVPRATTIASGENSSQNLMPTLFEWLRARWPTQLYATLSALVALALALRGWWETSQ
jgi:hypothetical protein